MKFYVTTPIYYVNDVPHIGHAYTTVAADVLARHHRLMGRDVFFLTGTDEHGQKVERSAKDCGETPIQLADRVVVRFKELWQRLHISNDDFIRTTEERHKKSVQELWRRIKANGYIYKGSYSGWYDVREEAFCTEGEVVERDGKKYSPAGGELEWTEESSYFFKLSEFQEPLLEYYEENPDFIGPDSRRNEIISFVKSGLRDLSVSRTSFKWGVPVPDDPEHIMYVWIDALTNYITGAGFPDEDSALYKKFWPADLHLVGKDIVRFHAVYWPAFLMAAGLPPPKRVFAHGWWTIEGQKMSKSLRNVVDPHLLIDEYGPDAIRYFLLREVPFGGDGDFSHKALIQRINGDLANDLGNLLSRSVGMLVKYFDGETRQSAGDPRIRSLAETTWTQFAAHIEAMAFHKALETLWALIRELNVYVDKSAPWTLAKQGETEKLAEVLYTALEGLRFVTRMLAAVTPTTAQKMSRVLGLDALPTELRWGDYPGGLRLQKPEALFPRIELDEKLEAVGSRSGVDLKAGGPPAAAPAVAEAPKKADKKGPAEPPAEIGFEDFGKVLLKVGKVLEAERVPKSEKLLKLQVDLGEERPRQIVAGIAKHYAPEDLVGRSVTIVANLKPAKLMGIESQGMILAAGDDAGLFVVSPTGDVPPGTRVK